MAPGDMPADTNSYYDQLKHKPKITISAEAPEVATPFSVVEEMSGKAMTIVAEANNKPEVEKAKKEAMKGIESLSEELENQLIENFAKNFMAKHPNKINLIQDKENIRVWNWGDIAEVEKSRLYLIKQNGELEGVYDKHGTLFLSFDDIKKSLTLKMNAPSEIRWINLRNNILGNRGGGFFKCEEGKLFFEDKDKNRFYEDSDKFIFVLFRRFIGSFSKIKV